MKKVLMISYFFPPSSSTGGTRPLKFVKYLRNFGWEPVVLTVRKVFDFGKPEDQGLISQIPEGVQVERTSALNLYRYYWDFRLSRKQAVKVSTDQTASTGDPDKNIKKTSWKKRLECLVNFPDIYWGWIPFGVMRGLKIIASNEIGVIYATTPYPSTLVIGYLLSKFKKIPLVIDYRDPWTDNYTGQGSPTWDIKRHYRLEQKIIRHAKKVITVTPTRKIELQQKYNIPEEKTAVITNGFDRDDAVDIAEEPYQKLTFIHPGQLYAGDGVNEFLVALEELAASDPEFCHSIQAIFLGSRPRDALFDELEARNLCRHIGHVPKKEALKEIAKSHVCLIFLRDSKQSRGWITSKIFDYMLFDGKTVLAVALDGDMARIIREHNMGYVCPYDKAQIKEAVFKIYENFRSGDLRRAFKSIESYDRKNLTKNLAEIFNDIGRGM